MFRTGTTCRHGYCFTAAQYTMLHTCPWSSSSRDSRRAIGASSRAPGASRNSQEAASSLPAPRAVWCMDQASSLSVEGWRQLREGEWCACNMNCHRVQHPTGNEHLERTLVTQPNLSEVSRLRLASLWYSPTLLLGEPPGGKLWYHCLWDG